MPTTYEPIATTTLSSTASSIIFSSIPATYTDLKLVLNPVVSAGASDYAIYLNYNSDTGTNYSTTKLTGNGNTAASSAQTSANQILIYGTRGYTTTPSLYIVDTFSYAGSTLKTCLISQSADYNGTGGVMAAVGLWRSTSAITSLELLNFGANLFGIGTIATLYGIKNA
jgi:hypothetical protein